MQQRKMLKRKMLITLCCLVVLFCTADGCTVRYDTVTSHVFSDGLACIVRFRNGSSFRQCNGGCYSSVWFEPAVSTGGLSAISDNSVWNSCNGATNCCTGPPVLYGPFDDTLQSVPTFEIVLCHDGNTHSYRAIYLQVSMPAYCYCSSCHATSFNFISPETHGQINSDYCRAHNIIAA